jgi:hypothetical protein
MKMEEGRERGREEERPEAHEVVSYCLRLARNRLPWEVTCGNVVKRLTWFGRAVCLCQQEGGGGGLLMAGKAGEKTWGG